ncbi:uncharacterized protein LOC134237683, partial [Saccostrea cucullata]|uniref:uncharacterized protein LOC134237683 n=1 Tax=Saccostrea cuccullata TaxID=36930 RepID=UPI002ED5B34E
MDKTVDTCPRNRTETVEASIRLGCGRDKYGNDQYMCLPNLETTSLVEFCHNGIMGFIESGNCLKTAEDKLFIHKCSNFVSGCPDVDFRSNEIYKYPACQNISTEHRCYLADPSCPNTTWDISTEETAEKFISKSTTNHVIYNTTAKNIHTTKFQEDDSAHIGAIMGIVVAVLGLILLLIIVRVVWKRMHKQKRKERKEFLTEKENLLMETEEKVVQGATKGDETGTSSKQNESENDITQSDEGSQNEEIKYYIRKVYVSSETMGDKVEIDDTETRVLNEPNDKKYGVNFEPAETDYSKSESDIHSDSKKKEHSITETDVNGELQERGHDVTETDVSRELQERGHDVTEAGVSRELQERGHDVTETDVKGELQERDHGITEVGVSIESVEGELGILRNSKSNIEGELELIRRMHIGDYSTWRTQISDEFSTLTDDDVLVLFCFLCSDSGPPDFTDSEWLDKLNEIRHWVYSKKNPVTSEEAQQTLDRLKSRDYLWEDQDKITEDTKDETMYRIASINERILYLYSSHDTASVYLRSVRHNRKPGEKCVSSLGCDSLLILRLQMNILTHVTMEDKRIYDQIHQILNVTGDMLKESKDKRKEFLMNLRREGETVHYRERSQDSVDHVTWLWRYGRPDIVRSCIGLHPHNDIYIIDNKAYRKPTGKKNIGICKCDNYLPKIRNLLYSMLLAEKYQLNVNEQSHRVIRDKIKDRYYPDITEDDSLDLPEGITETRDGVMTFISDDIRHDVMYAFVTECLVEDSDLEFFLTTASRDVISEYCRSWDYERSEGGRCLYIPYLPEKICDLFIDKLHLDIITHCTVSDWRIHDRISKRLGVPREVLAWDQEARERYVEYAKRGTQTVHHARGMIVGCAGVGKTTLLKRLLGCTEKEIKEVKSTEGLEVHEEIFELCDEVKSLKARGKYKEKNYVENTFEKLDAKTLTFFDFGGQCAYYACHQIYLTRRAFYIVVMDASKRLDQKVDEEVCDQDGSVFSGWTYG